MYNLSKTATIVDNEATASFSPLTLAEYLGLDDVVEAMVTQIEAEGNLNNLLTMDLNTNTKKLISEKLQKSDSDSSGNMPTGSTRGDTARRK